MKEKMLEFVIKRLGSKVMQLRDHTSFCIDSDAAESIVDDMDIYLDTLKDILKEVVLP
jgi:hypothetical protein